MQSKQASGRKLQYESNCKIQSSFSHSLSITVKSFSMPQQSNENSFQFCNTIATAKAESKPRKISPISGLRCQQPLSLIF